MRFAKVSKLVDIESILKDVPGSSAASLQKSLVDIILKSKNAPSLSADIAKRLLGLYREDRLATPEGLETLLETSIILEREKTAEKLQEMSLGGAAAKVRGG